MTFQVWEAEEPKVDQSRSDGALHTSNEKHNQRNNKDKDDKSTTNKHVNCLS
jgi:hypothetical protein